MNTFLNYQNNSIMKSPPCSHIKQTSLTYRKNKADHRLITVTRFNTKPVKTQKIPACDDIHRPLYQGTTSPRNGRQFWV